MVEQALKEQIQEQTHWIDTRLSPREMQYLEDCVSASKNENYNPKLVGNISNSIGIEDKDNWFFETVLKDKIKELVYRGHDVDEDQIPDFEMPEFWVNFQKQYEFNPLHNHGGMFSFVIFMKIPTHWKEQHALPFSAHSSAPCASNFEFIWPDNHSIVSRMFPLSPEDEGKMLFFPAKLMHQVYPFYGTEEERVTISGNITAVDNEKNKKLMQGINIPIDYNKREEKEKMLVLLEENVLFLRKELGKSSHVVVDNKKIRIEDGVK